MINRTMIEEKLQQEITNLQNAQQQAERWKTVTISAEGRVLLLKQLLTEAGDTDGDKEISEQETVRNDSNANTDGTNHGD